MYKRQKYQLPVAKNPCPADGATKREYAKQLVRQLNIDHPGVKDRMFQDVYKRQVIYRPKTCIIIHPL